MNKINWKVRFNKENKTFILRVFAAVIIPILAYLGLEAADITRWETLGQVLIDFATNPYLIGLTIFNALNMMPDPTTKGLGDSPTALQYKQPANSKSKTIGGK